jgi:Xaa-Pro aminopeptidase
MRHASLTRYRVALIVVAALAASALPRAERMGYPPEEFAARRQQLAKVLQRGTLLLFGGTSPIPGVRFRQDNDFYYLTGNESFNGVLVMDGASGISHLFLPKLSATEIRYEGGNWLDEPDAAKKYGFATIQPLTALHEFLARRRSAAGTEQLWTRLSERDVVDRSRLDTAIGMARRLTNPFAQQPTEDAARVTALREQFPYYEMKAVPVLRDEGRDSAPRSTANDQVAARDRDPQVQRPHQRRGTEARDAGHRARQV